MQDELMTYLLAWYRRVRRKLRVVEDSMRELQRDLRQLEKNKESYSSSDYIRLRGTYTKQVNELKKKQRKLKQSIEQCCTRIRQACGFSNA